MKKRWSFLKVIAIFMIYLTICLTFSIWTINPALAVENIPEKELERIACCQRTNSGLLCQTSDPANCDNTYAIAHHQPCEQTAFCRTGCCIAPNGLCSMQVPKAVCESMENYLWFADASCDAIPQCRKGCCVLGGASCRFTTEINCDYILRDYPELQKDFRNVNTEMQCTNICRESDLGCCVRPDDVCTWGTRGQCGLPDGIGSTGFYRGIFCSDNNLPCDCEPEAKKGCVEGQENVYWFDSCGNKEDIAEECDYMRGTLCTMPAPGYDQKEAFCKDLNCATTAIYDHVDYTGVARRHGESWCVYDSNPGPASDIPGSEHYRHLCINGEEIVEPCRSFREEICYQVDLINSPVGDYRQAGCIENTARDCYACNTNLEFDGSETERKINIKRDKLCCEESLKNCIWQYTNPNNMSGICIPGVPPGGKSYAVREEGAGEVTELGQECSLASTTITTIWEEPFLRKIAKTFDYRCIKNCEAFTEEFLISYDNFCRAMGDCGAHYSLGGEFRDDSFLRLWDGNPELAEDSQEFLRNPLEKPKDRESFDFYKIIKDQGLYQGEMDYELIAAYAGMGREIEERPYKEDYEWGKELLGSKIFGNYGFYTGLGIGGAGATLVGSFAYRSALKTSASAYTKSLYSEATEGLLKELIKKQGLEESARQSLKEGIINIKDGTATITDNVGEVLATTGVSEEAAKSAAHDAYKKSTASSWTEGVAFAVTLVIGLTMTAIAMHRGSREGVFQAGMFFATSAVSTLVMAAISSQVTLAGTAALGMSWTGIGLIVYAALAIALITMSLKTYNKKWDVTIMCEPWVPPLGGDACSTCDEDPLHPCTEYKCRSLGATCRFIKENEGTGKETCYDSSPYDVTRPVISPWTINNHPLSLMFKNEERAQEYTIHDLGNGYEIIGRIPAFSRINFGIKTDKPAQCRYTTEFKEQMTFSSMTHPFPDAYFDKEHNITISNLLPNKEYTFYIICRDPNGNPPEDSPTAPYVIKFETDNSQDLEPPLIIASKPPEEGKVKAGINSTIIELYIDEVSQFTCKYSTADKDYTLMESNVSCMASQEESLFSTYAMCAVEVPVSDEPITYYFRCQDYPINSDQNNVNLESYTVKIIPSEPLEIIDVSPNNTIIYERNMVLEARTARGSDNGKATCYFEDMSMAAQFFETESSVHKQEFTMLPVGDYDVTVTCEDEAGNVDQASVQFTIDVDEDHPELIRILPRENNVHLTFDEQATCEFFEETFEFGEGSKLGTNIPEHLLPRRSHLYFICEDRFGNMFYQPYEMIFPYKRRLV